jgi:hypothetical protein
MKPASWAALSIDTEHLLLGLLREGDLFIARLFSKSRLLPPDVEMPEAEPVPIELSELGRSFLRSLKISAD